MMMKRLMIAAALVLTSLAFTTKTSETDYSGLVGEWVTSAKEKSIITHVKFFPGGLLNIEKGNRNMAARYKVTRCALTEPLEVAGKIIISQNEKLDFTARIINRKRMDLTIDDPDSIKTYNLFKVKDIRTGMIPVQK